MRPRAGLAVLGVAALGLAALAPAVPAQEVAEAPGAVLRLLDKLSGAVTDIRLSRGEARVEGYLTVQLDACRYPVADPASNAYAHVTVVDARRNGAVFSGWMVAASPALSALDHPRYDVWVLRCDTT
jgi:hypothetical protein